LLGFQGCHQNGHDRLTSLRGHGHDAGWRDDPDGLRAAPVAPCNWLPAGLLYGSDRPDLPRCDVALHGRRQVQ
jgi:hypothetical protein